MTVDVYLHIKYSGGQMYLKSLESSKPFYTDQYLCIVSFILTSEVKWEERKADIPPNSTITIPH